MSLPPRLPAGDGPGADRQLLGADAAADIIIILGLKFGIFTPTEAAVVAAVYSLFVATVVYRELKWDHVYDVFLTAAKTTAVVMFLVAAAMVSAWMITVADLPGLVTELLEPLMDNQMLLLLAIMVLVVVVGTAMDMTPTILILTPVLALLWHFHKSCRKINGLSKEVAYFKSLTFLCFI